ncbi:NB-ARC - like 10 [Theobroma cacao]|nr:NB-ARC - like 10 [Theobroma cacao]
MHEDMLCSLILKTLTNASTFAAVVFCNLILVVLDDIWARLDLEEVGIPLGDQQKGCKILLTSRDQDVLFNGMDAKKTFAIGVLEESEAWHLFKKMAGDSVENLELWSTAIKVAQKCAGLPVAITTVARDTSTCILSYRVELQSFRKWGTQTDFLAL